MPTLASSMLSRRYRKPQSLQALTFYHIYNIRHTRKHSLTEFIAFTVWMVWIERFFPAYDGDARDRSTCKRRFNNMQGDGWHKCIWKAVVIQKMDRKRIADSRIPDSL